MRARSIILVVALILVALVYYYYEVPVAMTDDTRAVSLDPRNLSYEIENVRIPLVAGEAVTNVALGSEIKTVTRYFGNEARGDFNKDGKEDTAFLLTQESGGSGTFYYVAAALSSASGYRGTNALFLGDRIAPQTTDYRLGKIIVNFAERRPDEPMTSQPSVGVSKYFEIQGDSLVVSE